MKKAEKVAFVINKLEELYPNTPIPLDHTDPFTLLIAVLLSAQTTDKKVNEVSPALFAAAPDAKAMAQLEVGEIEKYIKQIGLYRNKAKHVKGLAQILTDKYQGQVPSTFPALEALPGVGHKTASVVMAQAFGHPAFPVDTHIHRLMWRWTLSSEKTWCKPKEMPNDFSQKSYGINCICKLYFLVGNTARQEVISLGNAQYAR